MNILFYIVMDSYNIDIIDLQNNLNNYNSYYTDSYSNTNNNSNNNSNNMFTQNYINRLNKHKRRKKLCKYFNIIVVIFLLIGLLQLLIIYKFDYTYIDNVFNKLRYNTYYGNNYGNNYSNNYGNNIINTNFDYYLFAQTFPITFCKTHKCTGTPNTQFIIHGLWPNYYDGSYPSFCTKEELDYNFINGNKDLFLKYWSDNNNKLDIDFINHEWTKHGTCANSSVIHNQHDYFLNTINIRKNIDIFSILRKNNIINNNKNYDKNMVINAIKNSLNVIPRLDCVKYNNKYILSGLYLGYNKNLQLINIPNYNNDFGCPNNFYYINENF